MLGALPPDPSASGGRPPKQPFPIADFWLRACRTPAAIAQLVERRVRDRKAADSRFGSRTRHALLCPWERRRLLSIGG